MSDPTTLGAAQQGTRLQAFVDAAFAFAVTLLVITSGEAIPRDSADFVAALERVPAFAAGFALIAMFWYAHVQWSARFALRDGWCTLLTFALVFTVLVFVHPLRSMSAGLAAFLTGGALPADLRVSGLAGFRLLAITFALAYFSMSALTAALYARGLSLLRRSGGGIRDSAIFEAAAVRNVWLIQSAVALGSLLFALSGVEALVQLSPWWYSLLAIVLPLYGYWERRRERAA